MANEILVPVDGSPESERAVDVAVRLARLLGCEIVVLWAWGDLSRIERAGSAGPEREAFASGLAVERCDPAGVAHHCRFPAGKPAAAILDAAGPQTRFIVMSTHGRSGFHRLHLGSVADRIMRTAQTPTILLPPAEQPGEVEFRRVMVTLDGSARAEEALPLAHEIARASGGALLLLRSVATPMVGAVNTFTGAYAHLRDAGAPEAEDYLQGIAARYPNCPSEQRVRTTGARSAILEASGDADPIVLCSRGRGGLPRLVLGSVADEVVRHATRPVLIVHPAGIEGT